MSSLTVSRIDDTASSISNDKSTNDAFHLVESFHEKVSKKPRLFRSSEDAIKESNVSHHEDPAQILYREPEFTSPDKDVRRRSDKSKVDCLENSDINCLRSKLNDAEEEAKDMRQNLMAISLSLRKTKEELDMSRKSRRESKLELTRELEQLKMERAHEVEIKNIEIEKLKSLIIELNDVVDKQTEVLNSAVYCLNDEEINSHQQSNNSSRQISVTASESDATNTYWSYFRDYFVQKRRRDDMNGNSGALDCWYFS